MGFPGGSAVKNPPAMQKMEVPSLGQEDLLEEEMATHSSNLADNPVNRGTWRAIVHGSKKVGYDWATKQDMCASYPIPSALLLCSFFSFYFLKIFLLFMFACAVSLLLCWLSLVAVSGCYSLLQCTGFWLRWLLLLQSTGSRACGLQ